ncbi:Rho GTPase activation protein [Polychaeton citri CBS 116435]|uniref:Rho GTPase activation protein n=1 Tax=Polychaeton citri CBS 116435 TaxID=1314669 RepID=A0A9P4UU50_9PEZI|nr:Rho GTPase activation protein [Polychaeton citri CBS 116435]
MNHKADNTPVPPKRSDRLSPQPSPHSASDTFTNTSAKSKDTKSRTMFGRAKSIRRDSNSRPRPTADKSNFEPPKTAPLDPNWASSTDMFKGRGKDTRRGKSAERPMTRESGENLHASFQAKDGSVHREKDKSSFVNSSKNVMSKAKSGGGNFLNRLGKIGRSSSDHKAEPEVSDSQYVTKVINKPLIEQTRLTRISKDMTTCRDKTEFWMPALPWRCIDYLNLHCETEGLYRIPGSVPQVKKWQRRFDTVLDINIFEASEEYIEHDIASMLKAWLRDLPTEIFPKQLQHELAAELERENPMFRDAPQVPSKVRECLSDLPPFNYYLLFAITCHLSLLLSNQQKNKMNLENLAICIGPGLNLERWLFNFLVGDWRHCWAGCAVEEEFLDAERAWANGEDVPSNSAGPGSDANSQAGSVHNESAVSSDGASGKTEAFEDARATNEECDAETPKVSRRGKAREGSEPSVYMPSGYGRYATGGVRTPDRVAAISSQEVRRPATAENAEPRAAQRDRSHSRTPRQASAGHNRSQSDLPLTPVKGTVSGGEIPMLRRPS